MGHDVTFTTSAPPATAPTVTTTAPTTVTSTTADPGGNVTWDGDATVTERGVVYSTNTNPDISDNLVTSGSGTGSYTQQALPG